MKSTGAKTCPVKQVKSLYTLIDLFAGCGGFSQGFLQEGFEIVAANEFWEPAQLTYEKNHPGVYLIKGDITEKKTQEELFNAAGEIGIGVIIGGPPCQAYSNAGYRDPKDPRGKLFEEYVKIVNHLQPMVFVMENVTGLLSMKHIPDDLSQNTVNRLEEAAMRIRLFKELDRSRRQKLLSKNEEESYQELLKTKQQDKKFVKNHQIPVVELIANRFSKIGYRVEYQVLNAADYGVPQARRRVFFIGTREDIPIIFPEPTHGPGGTGTKIKEYRIVKETIDDLKNLPEGAIANHNYTAHKPKFIERLKRAEIGKSLYKNYSDAWWRCYPDKPARTVKENHGGVFIHYEKPRVLTPRELARLQTFPDDFVFESTKSMVLKQIGNAVPPVMARAIARAVKKMLNDVTE
ncbi:MAG: DNA cytosine methyltransferase [Candidatus Odinarchaeota archaeon]